MLNSKKIISALLALSMVTAYSASVCTAETVPQSASVCSEDSGRSINWTYTSTVGAGFYIDGNYGSCIGTYELYSNMKAEITVTLMKSKNGKSWSAVEHWTETHYSYSPSSTVRTSTNELEHGYYYLTHVQVQVLDDNDDVLETGNSESAGKYYA